MTLAKDLSQWGSRLTWIARRKLAAQVMRGVKSHKVAAPFLSSAVVRRDNITVPRIRCGQQVWQTNYRTGDHVTGLDIMDRARTDWDGSGGSGGSGASKANGGYA